MIVARSTFGTRLKELREAAGLTQYALAKKSDLTVQAIANLESPAKPTEPTWKTVCKLAHALKVSVAEFDVASEAKEEASGTPRTKKRRKK